jgi:hypothetical protein
MAENQQRTSSRETLRPGTKVDVRTGFDRSWASGFIIEERTLRGYRLRRVSDGSVLPSEFAFDDVRREHKSLWWV